MCSIYRARTFISVIIKKVIVMACMVFPKKMLKSSPPYVTLFGNRVFEDNQVKMRAVA